MQNAHRYDTLGTSRTTSVWTWWSLDTPVCRRGRLLLRYCGYFWYCCRVLLS